MSNNHDYGNNNSGLFGAIHGLSFGLRTLLSSVKTKYDDTQSQILTADKIIPGVYQDRKGYFRDKVTNQWVYYDPISNMLYNKYGRCVRSLDYEDWELRWATLKQMYNGREIISAKPSDKQFTNFPGRYYWDNKTGHRLVPRRVRVSLTSIWGYEKINHRLPENKIPGDWIDYYVDIDTGLLARETDQHIYYRFVQRYEVYPDIYTDEYIQSCLKIINGLIMNKKIKLADDFNIKKENAKDYYTQNPDSLFAIQIDYIHHPETEQELRNWYDTDYFHELKYFKQWDESEEHYWIKTHGGFKANVGYSNWNELAEKYKTYAKINRNRVHTYNYIKSL